MIASLKKDKYLMFLKDWRRCCERIYKHINTTSGSDSVSWVITDSRCNLHLTSSDCYERAVRLPAALKGARQAKGNIRIINTVGEKYLDLAENDVIRRAHKMSYIERIKKRCLAATEDDVVALTDDSDGNGGEDTSKLSVFNLVFHRSFCFGLILTSKLSRYNRGVKGNMECRHLRSRSCIAGGRYDYERGMPECFLCYETSRASCRS